MNHETVDIVLIEDSPTDLELTLHALRQHGLANDIRVARDGIEAMDVLFGDGHMGVRPRFILLDLKLPKMDGFDVLRRIRSDPRTQTVPVVVLTSSRQDPDIDLAYSLGANSYVVKPVDFEQFAEVVRTAGLYWLVVNEAPDR